MEKLTLKEAAERLGVMGYNLMYLIEAGAITAPEVKPFEGQFWHENTVILFSTEALEEARAELERRKFPHVFEQFDYVVEPDAHFAFGPGWEQILRVALTKLIAIPGPPKVSGGKEKLGCLVLHVGHEPAEWEPVNAIREDLRKRSLTVCEECGKPGRLRMGHSICKTTCDDHARLVGDPREDDGKIFDCFR